MAELSGPSTPQPGLLSLCHIRNTFSRCFYEMQSMKCNVSPDPHCATKTLVLPQRAARDPALPLVFGAHQPPCPPEG